MGLFENFKSGLAEAGDFLVQNSGATFDIAKTVGQAAGIISLTAELYDDHPVAGELKAELLLNLRTANENVLKKAESIVPKPSDAAFADVEPQVDIMNGLWTLATLRGYEVVAPVPIYKDIAAFMQAHNIPLSVPQSSIDGSDEGVRGLFDMAAAIANALFTNLPPLHETRDRLDERGIQYATCLVSVGDAIVAASHAYYIIPTGDIAEDPVWHSAIYFHTFRTDQFKNTEKAARRAEYKSLVTPRPKRTGGIFRSTDRGLNWLITLQIRWSSVSLAQSGAAQIIAYFNKQEEYTVDDQTLFGSMGIIKVRGPRHSTPGLVREMVLNAVRIAIDKLAYGSIFGGRFQAQDAPIISLQLPAVSITFSTLTNSDV